MLEEILDDDDLVAAHISYEFIEFDLAILTQDAEVEILVTPMLMALIS